MRHRLIWIGLRTGDLRGVKTRARADSVGLIPLFMDGSGKVFEGIIWLLTGNLRFLSVAYYQILVPDFPVHT
ncbi:hypothetical protein Csa_002170 [Cucumis sativus]|uniref:Uncharacterized protein n=1 Tax=Cucumis sativus TaxID=3659 RepID=A0A0A0L9W6_CUCSA|nr:hypothetical protein Csa_002170 [Cucumis sativus]